MTLEHPDTGAAPSTAHSPAPLLPATLDELERVRLDLRIAVRDREIDEMRARITSEEAQQRLIQRQIDDRLGMLRMDVDRLTTEIQRLEARIERLAFSRRALSDSELDSEEHAARAEEAAFWAEWREKREARQRDREAVFNVRPQVNSDDALRQAYRTLARLIHPDLARDQADRNRREAVMRLANAANEARDIEQLRRLIALWSRPEAGQQARSVDALRARLADRDLELGQLQRQLTALEASQLGTTLRRPRADLNRYIKREEDRLRRESATLRLRRRRLVLQLEERRKTLAQASD